MFLDLPEAEVKVLQNKLQVLNNIMDQDVRNYIYIKPTMYYYNFKLVLIAIYLKLITIISP